MARKYDEIKWLAQATAQDLSADTEKWKRSFEKMLNAIRVQEKLVRNKYEIKKKTFEISIKSTEYNEDMLGRKVSNIEEFFDVIDW